MRDGETVGGDRIRLQLHRTIGPHAHGLAQHFLNRIRAQRDRDHLAGAPLLLQLERDLDGVRVEVAHVELHSRLVDAFPARGNSKPRLHVGDALDADGDLHLNAFKPVIA
jgi:hypothetical protein